MTAKRREELQFAFGELYVFYQGAEGCVKDIILDVMMTIKRVLRDEEETKKDDNLRYN